VLLFVIFVIYQRLQIARFRRQLSMQMATVATLAALKPLSPEERRGQKERRRWQLLQVDELLKVIAKMEGKERQVYGRVRDVSENGLGAVIPDALNPGDTVTLTFALGKSASFTLMATVRHWRGFHYGFEYQNVPAATLQSLKASLISIGYSADLQPLA
jgi:PilZ domain-containing protein